MLKRYIFLCLPLIFLLNSQGHSHGPFPPWFYEVVTFHPGSLIYGITKSETLIYLTIKWPLHDIDAVANSADDDLVRFVIINPSYLNKEDYYRIGSGFGYRHYVVPDWFYFQLKPGLHYLKYEDASSGPMIETLGYAGISVPYVGFLDAGVGYKWNHAKKNHGLATEINLGLPLIYLIGILTFPFLIFTDG